MPESNIPITLPNGTVLNGVTPVVFIGPNGSGKTRFGVAIARSSSGTRIPALRSLAFEQTIQPRATTQAAGEAENKITRYNSEYHIQADEINEMLSELKAEHNDIASQFLDAYRSPITPAQPKLTRLEKFLRIWHQTFPGRKLDFSTYQPKVISNLGLSPQNYQANTMSDGERVAIYLIARVLRAPAGVIVVDEPEVHFHSLLARNFWDTLQIERADCRFLYITHDLSFALSRRNTEIGIVKNNTEVEMVNRADGIPAEIIQEILGAASLSLVAKRIVFTEGIPGVSIDAEIYGAWFESPDTAVVPVGSCRAVQDAVRVFQQKKIFSNATPLGIIERDYLPERYLNRLVAAPELFILPTHEIEGLLCLREVAACITKHLGMNNSDFNIRYSAFEEAVRTSFIGGRLHKHLMERIKSDIDGQLDGFAHGVTIDANPIVLRETVVKDLTEKFGKIDPGKVFDEQKAYVDYLISQQASEFLKVLPGKDCLKILLKNLEISEDQYINLISVALRQPNGTEEVTFKRLKDELVIALSPHLPSR